MRKPILTKRVLRGLDEITTLAYMDLDAGDSGVLMRRDPEGNIDWPATDKLRVEVRSAIDWVHRMKACKPEATDD